MNNRVEEVSAKYRVDGHFGENELAGESSQKNLVPVGYKQTEVGVVPEDWDAVQLKSVFSIKNGYAFKGEFFSSNGPIVLTPGNFKVGGGLYFDLRNTKRYRAEYPKGYEFEFGDLVIVMTDLTPDCNLLGKPAFVMMEEKVLHNQRIGKIERLNGCWDPQYLYFSLLSTSYLSSIKNAATGSTVRHTSPRTIGSAWATVPPKKEQTAIANALSDVDALVANLESLITKKQAIKTATMQQLLTGRTRLPQFALREDGSPKGYKQSELGEVPEDWEVQLFKEVTELITCGIAATPQYVAESVGVPFLSSTNVKNGIIVWGNFKHISRDLHSRLYRNNPPSRGDILYSRVGTIGESAVIDSEVEFSIYVSLTLIKPKKMILNSYFLSQVLNSQPYRRRAKEQVYLGGGVGNLNVDVVRSYPIPLPPRQEQAAIATILSDMDQEIQTLEQRLEKTRQIKQGMMQQLLTGKIRLVKPEVSR